MWYLVERAGELHFFCLVKLSKRGRREPTGRGRFVPACPRSIQRAKRIVSASLGFLLSLAALEPLPKRDDNPLA